MKRLYEMTGRELREEAEAAEARATSAGLRNAGSNFHCWAAA